ncbi:MAG: hypothetical protein PHR35_16875, partial [Kiritimatiellae bacterium]|nr:hypothetical protein [Kiritimatiellia bacterium]
MEALVCPMRGAGTSSGKWREFRRSAGTVLLALAMCGCSTTAMKGTPFYSGEYTKRVGPAENRVNLWPLLYYRDPALSVLWPIGEYTDDRLAIRPIFSVENLDEEERVYNVLWPLARFDLRSGEHRVFPFFWSDDHRVVFPLYWHFDDPFAEDGKGSDSLWPLWCYFRDREQHSLHLLWPFFNAKSYDDERGWRLWPLYGSYEEPSRETGHSYALWPLAWHTWGKASQSWTLLPIFHDTRGADAHTLGTLLGGWRHDREDEATAWYALPLLGWGVSSPESSCATALLGLYGHRRDAAGRGSRLLPFYYSRETTEGRLFLSPLYASATASNGACWHMFTPLAIHRQSPAGRALYTPIYSEGASVSDDTRWSCLLPLYYADSSPAGSTFVTALGGWWTDTSHRSWAVYPLLSGGRRRDDGGDLWLGGPVFHATWDAAGTSHWLLPLYTYNHRRDRLLSPLYSAWHNDGAGMTRLLPPLLSAYASRTNRWDCWGLAGLAHASGGSEAGSSHLFPLFYADRRDDTFVSPLYASWNADAGRTRVLPPLLSAWHGADDGGEVLGLLGLFRARWGEQETSDTGHLVPLYYYDHDTLLTPLVGHWASEGVTSRFWLTPLLGTRSGHERGSWLWPLYSYAADPVRELSHGSFLIFGNYRHTSRASRTRFPLLFAHERWRSDPAAMLDDPATARTGWRLNLLLLAQGAGYDYIKTYATIPKSNANDTVANAKEPRHHRECRFFPLWDFKSDRNDTGSWERANGNLLYCLYDYRHERGHQPTGSAPYDYTRRRVLFRLYHHERLNGATSIDIFPAMTYDSDPAADKRQFSLLWWLFRYQRDPERPA